MMYSMLQVAEETGTLSVGAAFGWTIALAVILIVGGLPVIGSMVICVPKWWHEGRVGNFARSVGDRIPTSLNRSIQIPEKVWLAMAFGMNILFGALFYICVAPFVWWWRRVEVFIWTKCPYSTTHEATWDVQDRIKGRKNFWPKFFLIE